MRTSRTMARTSFCMAAKSSGVHFGPPAFCRDGVGRHQHGRRLDAHGAQQRLHQCRAVLAVAVAVGQHAVGAVRHHAAVAQVDADVADILAHPFVDGDGAFALARDAGRDFLGLGGDGRRDGGRRRRLAAVGLAQGGVILQGRYDQVASIVPVWASRSTVTERSVASSLAWDGRCRAVLSRRASRGGAHCFEQKHWLSAQGCSLIN